MFGTLKEPLGLCEVLAIGITVESILSQVGSQKFSFAVLFKNL